MASALRVPSLRPLLSGPTSLSGSVLLGLLSAVLLDFCFPVAGPLSPWHASLAWIALVPLFRALLSSRNTAHPHYLRRAALTGYLSGVTWYILNCYWIYQTMYFYGHVPALGSVGILILFSLVLGLYFGAFGLLLALFRRRLGLTSALVLAPFLWTALELAASRITSVPWDQLGYSQVDNLWLTRLAPVTGVYGISFVLIAVSALFAAATLAPTPRRLGLGVFGLIIAAVLQAGSFVSAPPAATSAYAVLLQPNLDVSQDNTWIGPEWTENVSWILDQSRRTCTPAYNGVPDRRPPILNPPQCSQNQAPPGLVAWPEAPSMFVSSDPRTIALLQTLATTAHAPVIAGMFGEDRTGTYNSGVFAEPDGAIAGRYDKIHLVPFGEFVPYRSLFFFAKKLTHQLVDLQRGHIRTVFHADGHGFGVFICYESVFADEVRHFALNGAQVLVNISDDGWYGDTSAPWQHLNMTRMRAIENNRWLLLDTNNGVTTAIDPRGRVTLSIPRHRATALVVRYGYRTGLTFYTRYGDLFAWFCVAFTLAALGWSLRRQLTR